MSRTRSLIKFLTALVLFMGAARSQIEVFACQGTSWAFTRVQNVEWVPPSPLPWQALSAAGWPGNGSALAVTSLSYNGAWLAEQAGVTSLVDSNGGNRLNVIVHDPTNAGTTTYAVVSFDVVHVLTAASPFNPPTWSTSVSVNGSVGPTWSLAVGGPVHVISGTALMTFSNGLQGGLVVADCRMNDTTWPLRGDGATESSIVITVTEVPAPIPCVVARSYGTGVAGTGGITPMLRLDPVVAPRVDLEIRDGLAGSLAAVLMSTAGPGPVQVGAFAFDLDLPIIALTIRSLDANGDGQWSLPIPPTLQLPQDAWFQGAVLDSAAPSDLATTNALTVTIS